MATFKYGLKIACVVWPGLIAFIILLLLRDERFEPMSTFLWCVIALVLVWLAFVAVSRLFSDPPDLTHPD